MSGGVDSSVAALLLREQGYAVEGLFMKNWEEDDGTEYCTAKEDFADAQSVADTLDIKLHGANFAAEYWDKVFAHFLEEYRNGRTPNPDILCNREIKFKAFLEYALSLGADYIATGHYSRRGSDAGKVTLLKGLDDNKDQSYFLHAVGHHELEKTLFPVGEIEKPEVRRTAEKHQLVTHNKKDSTGICFIGERRFSDFLKQYIPAQSGEIRALEGGELLGVHQGLMYHTIGQRQGLGIGGTANHGDAPWYVVEKDLANNVLLVAQGNNHPALFSTTLTTGNIFWVSGSSPVGELGKSSVCLSAKVRYRQSDQECKLTTLETGYRVDFEQAQRAVTPGQSVVFYRGDRCLGGGVIEASA